MAKTAATMTPATGESDDVLRNFFDAITDAAPKSWPEFVEKLKTAALMARLELDGVRVER